MPRLTDRGTIRALLESDRPWSAYALGDLADGFYERGLWLSSAPPTGALLLLYRGFDTPVLFTLGPPDAVRGLLREMGAVPRLHLHVRPEIVPLVRERYCVDDLRFMWRMTLDPERYRARGVGEVIRLGTSDVSALEELYADGQATDERPDFFTPDMVGQGIYYGMREGAALVAAGGTHLLSVTEGVGTIGNVYTRRDRRGRGYAATVTSAVASALLAVGVQTIALNVNQHNAAAVRLYERLGFVRYCAFCEGIAVQRPAAEPSPRVQV